MRVRLCEWALPLPFALVCLQATSLTFLSNYNETNCGGLIKLAFRPQSAILVFSEQKEISVEWFGVFCFVFVFISFSIHVHDD